MKSMTIIALWGRQNTGKTTTLKMVYNELKAKGYSLLHKPDENEGDFYRYYIGGAEMRVKVTLACTECKQRNYNTMKNKKNTPDRLEMNKHCPFCKKHTLHRETK